MVKGSKKITVSRVIRMDKEGSIVVNGAFEHRDGTFSWVNGTKHGKCKKAITAIRRAGYYA